GAGGIDRTPIAPRPGTDDDQLGSVDLAHREQTPSCALRQSACSKGGSRFLHRNQGCAAGANLFAVRALTVRGPGGPPLSLLASKRVARSPRMGRMRIDALHNLVVAGSYARY